jgi:hypothetical protein
MSFRSEDDEPPQVTLMHLKTSFVPMRGSGLTGFNLLLCTKTPSALIPTWMPKQARGMYSEIKGDVTIFIRGVEDESEEEARMKKRFMELAFIPSETRQFKSIFDESAEATMVVINMNSENVSVICKSFNRNYPSWMPKFCKLDNEKHWQNAKIRNIQKEMIPIRKLTPGDINSGDILYQFMEERLDEGYPEGYYKLMVVTKSVYKDESADIEDDSSSNSGRGEEEGFHKRKKKVAREKKSAEIEDDSSSNNGSGGEEGFGKRKKKVATEKKDRKKKKSAEIEDDSSSNNGSGDEVKRKKKKKRRILFQKSTIVDEDEEGEKKKKKGKAK